MMYMNMFIQVAKSRYSKELNSNIDIQEKINNADANENPEEIVSTSADDTNEETIVEPESTSEAGVEMAEEGQV